jgi:hypothetical protein
VHGVPDAATKQLPAWFDPAEAPMPGCVRLRPLRRSALVARGDGADRLAVLDLPPACPSA